MPEKVKLKQFLIWCVMTVCFVGVPALLIFATINKYCQLIESERQADLKISLQQVINESASNENPEKYWGSTLGEKFRHLDINQAQTDEPIRWLQQQRQNNPDFFDYLVWTANGEIATATCADQFTAEEWREVFIELSSLNYGWGENFKHEKKADLSVVRKVLGPQYIAKEIEESIAPKSYGFAWTDSALQQPFIWAYFTEYAGYLVLLKQNILQDKTGLQNTITRLSQPDGYQFGVFKPNLSAEQIWPEQLSKQFSGLPENLFFCENELKNFQETDEYYLCFGFLSPENRVFGCGSKIYTRQKRLFYAAVGAFFLVLLMSPFLLYTWKTIVNGIPGSLSIRPRIAFVFLFACAIPILTMTIFAREHYAQKRSADLKSIHQRSLALLQNYDVRMQSLTSHYEHQMKNYLEEWAEQRQGQTLDQSSNEDLKKKCRQMNVDSYFLVCSHTPLVGSFNGVDNFKESLEEQKIKEKDSTELDENGQPIFRNSDAQNSQVANIIGKRIMGELNGQPQSNKDADRMELLFESVLQKSFAEITHSFIKVMGGVSPWGFGKSMNMALLNFMTGKKSATIDFMALIIWSSSGIQRNYLLKTINEVNRNPIGLKIVAQNSYFSKEIHPGGYVATSEVRDFMKRLTDQPTEEIEIINIDGEPFMAVGFNGKHLIRYQLLGLYPISQLERQASRQRSDLILLASFCIILAAWMAQLLAQSFLNPLNSLQSAALAIEKREFQFRLADTGKDEFGEVASIFNDVMISLEELEVAKVVQESLFPDAGQQAGGFRVYGRSMAMAELGGDYFDYFAADENHLAVLMGDVAGHGVGAALIMAMAKAGIIRCREQLKQPVKVLERLHELIYSSKTRKQKKIMTFQYLCAEVATGMVTYANAGGCSPIFFSKARNDVNEISLSGAALGAFKKGSFNETTIQFSPGDLMVFYTDGIIEARSQADKELGYENFASLVKSSWHENPEEVYNKICAGYRQHIAGMDAQDDLTMVIICYTG